MPEKIRIIGVPMDLGASRRGVDMGPSALRVAGLQSRLKQLGRQVEDIGNVLVPQPEEQPYGEKRARYLDEISQACKGLADAVKKTLDEDMIQLGEGLVSAVVQSVATNRTRELALIERDVTALLKITPPFPRITYDDAIKVLQKAGNPAKWGDDFGGDEETIISKEFDRPVIIHRYPAAMKAFYMATDAARPELSLSFDMIAPEGYGEIIGGGERLADYDTLIKRLREHNLPEESFQWYLDLRRYGSVPHAGFGLGLERTVAWICGTEHIREVIPFPRMLYRVYP